MLVLWDFLNHIGHYKTGLVNTSILNQLLGFFRFMVHDDNGEAALQVFRKFEEVFHCLPNQDTYTEIMLTIIRISSYEDRDRDWRLAKADVKLKQLAASICKRMLLQPQTLLPDDGSIFGKMLTFFSYQGMIEETHALYLAGKEKLKTDPNWPKPTQKEESRIEMLLPIQMINNLCTKQETVYLALEMLTGIDNPNELEGWEDTASSALCNIILALCLFEDFDAAKQLIFKMCGDGQLPRPSYQHIRPFIRHSVRTGEIRQALEMLVLSERLGLNTCDLFSGTTCSDLSEIVRVKKILEEAKKNKDLKSITVLLYHTLIVGYCRLAKFGEARELLTQMKDFGVSHTNLNEYHKLIHSLCLMEMDTRMAKEEISKITTMNWNMQKEQLKEMELKIRASF